MGEAMLKDKYQKPVTIIFPEMVARVYSPILASDEREKRMKAIHTATKNIIENRKW